jgi:hypothetical protein
MGSVLRLFLAEEDADPERLDTLTGYLRADLMDLDVEDVSGLPADTIPAGARSGIVTVIGGLLVNLGDAADGLAAVVSAVSQWLKRGDAPDRMVRIELDGDVLELHQPTPADQEQLIRLFVSRHQPGTNGG